MQAQDLARLKEKLQQHRQQIVSEEHEVEDAAKPVELDQCCVGRLSRVDAMQSQAMAQATFARMELQLKRIDAALARIEQGEYGLCRLCDEPIDPRRLEFDPATPYCIGCAVQQER